MQLVINSAIPGQCSNMKSTTIKGSSLHSLGYVSSATRLAWLFSFYVNMLFCAKVCLLLTPELRIPFYLQN